MNLAQALAHARTQGLDRLDAQLLLLHVLGRPSSDRAWLIAHDTDLLEAGTAAAFGTLARRRAAGEPLAYLVGQREFHGLPLQVDARVLVPRPETETLVEWALQALAASAAGLQAPPVLDLGTGSGAIALALKQARPDAAVTAVDASAGALEVARANAARLGLDVAFLHGSWFTPVRGRFAVIASNPPYVAEGDAHLPALAHEPRLALTSGADGLDAISELVAAAPAHLLSGGWLLLEHGWDQAPAVRALLAARGFQDVQSRDDLAGIARCSGGFWSGRG